MGWISYVGSNKKPKEELDNRYRSDKYKLIKSSVPKYGEYYAAIQNIHTGKIYCDIIKFHFANGCFSYKDMSEFDHPYMYNCPVGIFKMLSPTDNHHALSWREKQQERYNILKVKYKNYDVVEISSEFNWGTFIRTKKLCYIEDKFYPIIRSNVGNMEYVRFSGIKPLSKNMISDYSPILIASGINK